MSGKSANAVVNGGTVEVTAGQATVANSSVRVFGDSRVRAINSQVKIFDRARVQAEYSDVRAFGNSTGDLVNCNAESHDRSVLNVTDSGVNARGSSFVNTSSDSSLVNVFDSASTIKTTK